MKRYNPMVNVLEAARKRVSILFDNFKNISVSVSSGKDSTVIYSLCLQEAIKRDRQIQVFFLDQEAEYENSINLIKKIMFHKNVIPQWFQVPLYLTNSTSSTDFFLYAWGPDEKWIRDKNPIAIKEIPIKYPNRFYTFFPWYESGKSDTAFIVGLRGEESMTRYRATTKNPGWNGYKWSTITGDANKFYPIYDWTVYDVWKFIYDYNIEYNKIYDLMFIDNKSIYSKMRVSNLIHEKSYKCLVDLPRYEPETYSKLCKRISGISTAARYASERLMFNNKKLPDHYKTWKQFRDFILEQKSDKHRAIYEKRFNNQVCEEITYKAQVGQLLIDDYENSKPIDTTREKKVNEIRDKWRTII